MSKIDDLIALTREQNQLLRDLLMPPATDETPVDCEHPEERRQNVSTWGDTNHWICGVCRFDNKTAA